MRGLFGGLLIVVGFLIAGASGMCILGGMGDLAGIPLLIGIVLLAIGIAMVRSVPPGDHWS